MISNVEMHVMFEADGDKTNFTFSIVHETEEYCKQQEEMGFREVDSRLQESHATNQPIVCKWDF